MASNIYNLNNLLNMGWHITEHDKRHNVYYLADNSGKLTAQVYAISGNVFYYQVA